MKTYRIILIAFLLFAAQPATAANDSLIPGDVMNYIGYGLIAFMLVLFMIVILVLLKTFRILSKIIFKYQGVDEDVLIAALKPVKKEKKPKAEVWQKLLSLKPMAQENELLIAHDYDGIQELNNPIPAWFMYLFYSTIVFAVGYLLVYHVFGIGQLQYAEYKTEMVQADIDRKVYLSKAANQVDENTVKLTADAGTIAAGQATFIKTCAPCHGDHAQGNVGPNLTDDFWLHGGKINDVFKTIKYGVAAKGMPTWEKQLSPKQIAEVANFIKSVHGTNPAGAKAPQGVKDVEVTQKIAAN